MAIKYSGKVIEHFMNPKNMGEIKNPDGYAEKGNPACGDVVSLTIKVEKDRIKDIKFQSYGCASNIATASVLTEMAKGKDLKDAEKISWKDVMEELGGLPSQKIHCSVLAVETLKEAIKDYKEKNNRL